MIYIVIAKTNDSTQKIAVKHSMDDALDVIQAMEDFDKEEALQIITEYSVYCVRKEG